MESLALALLIIANLPVFGLFTSVMFNKGDFIESIKYFFIPEIISAFRGEYIEDCWAEVKLLFWVVMCASLIWSELNFIEQHIPSLYIYFDNDFVYPSGIIEN
jgi:hypothetical protein